MEKKDIYVLTETCVLISKEGKKIRVDKEYLYEFKYFQKIFEDEADLEEIKLEEETFDQLKALFDCMYTETYKKEDIPSITYLLVKWMYEGEFCYLRLGFFGFNELELVYPKAEDNFACRLKDLMNDPDNKKILKILKLSSSMKACLFDILIG